MDVVMSVCDRLYVLNFGEVIASGDVETVRRDPSVVAAYLGVNN
jgi:branched-chain amino acid transport system ATP-binding protein